ncbi:MAG: malectin domain-containing carbohydrate-binding protein [Verrucomicrobiota bacterium]
MKRYKYLLGTLLCTWTGTAVAATLSTGAHEGKLVEFAAREIGRYTWLRTGEQVERVDGASANIVLKVDAGLGKDTFTLKTDGKTLSISGGSDLAVLYGAYRYAELLGVRFYIHGDVVPDGRIPFALPEVDETHTPLFEHRGIQPFHDFTEGPDWWSLDDYKTYLGQMVKMRMNWIGFHCYPEGGVGPEPLVWIGLPEDVNEDGTVKWGYPTALASTRGGRWGYEDTPVEEFAAGAGNLFSGDDFGASVTDGFRPLPETPEDCAEVFNRTGRFFNEVLGYADELGIHTVLGTEVPLTIPAALKERMREKGLDPESPEAIRKAYDGMFLRIKRTHPLGTYWVWTPETWTWQGNSKEELAKTVDDINILRESLAAQGNPFGFGTCGWVLGPASNRSLFDDSMPPDVAMGCINRDVGFTPVETGFASIKDRPKWAIPWVEDDPAMITPQLWAGRLRRDAADALAYGCTGLIGIHWRTKVLSHNFAALAAAAWDQSGWNTEPDAKIILPKGPTTDFRLSGNFGGTDVALKNADPEALYQTCRWAVGGYKIQVPNGTYDVTLRFCEFHFDDPGKRVFDVVVEGKTVAEGFDAIARAGKFEGCDLVLKDVKVEDDALDIGFINKVDNPFIAGISIEGRTAAANQVAGKPFERHVNCGGGTIGDFEDDLPDSAPVAARDLPRDLPAEDFYVDWCLNQFGTSDKVLAELFVRHDGAKGKKEYNKDLTDLPRPAAWGWGPGMIIPDSKPWTEEKERYAFVDEMASLRPTIKGNGNLARFDYWLNSFRYLRAVGKAACTRGTYDAAMKDVAAHPKKALALRIELARDWEKLMKLQLSVTDTPGGMGTIANLEQHVRRCPDGDGVHRFLDCHDAKLAEALGEALPPEAEPTTDYLGEARLTMPTVRTSRNATEALTLKAIVLDKVPAKRVALHWRTLGGEARTLEFSHSGRGVYEVELPANAEMVEYYVAATTAGGEKLLWPATAPNRCQTVVVLPD